MRDFNGKTPNEEACHRTGMDMQQHTVLVFTDALFNDTARASHLSVHPTLHTPSLAKVKGSRLLAKS